MRSRKILASLGAVVLASSALFAAVVPAQASVVGDVASPAATCNSSKVYDRVTSKKVATKYLGVRRHLDNRSGKNTVTQTVRAGQSGSVKASISGSLEGGIKKGIVVAKAQVNGSIVAKANYTSSMSVKLTAPRKTIKYAQLTTNMYTVNMESYLFNRSCKKVTVGTSKLKAPSSIGWKTW